MTDVPAAQPATVPPGGGGLPPVAVVPPAPPPVEQIEIEARDKLGIYLAEAALKLAQQTEMLSVDADPQKAKDMAQAALYLTEALVLVAPLESTGATAGPGGGPVPIPPKHMPPQASLNFAEQQATGRSA